MSYMGNISKPSHMYFIRDGFASNTKVTDINSGNAALLNQTNQNPASAFFDNKSMHSLKNTVYIPYFNTVRNIDTSGTRGPNTSYSDYYIKMRFNISNIEDTGSACLFGAGDFLQSGITSAAGGSAVPMTRAPRQRIALNKSNGLLNIISFNTVSNRDGLKNGSFALQSIVLKD